MYPSRRSCSLALDSARKVQEGKQKFNKGGKKVFSLLMKRTKMCQNCEDQIKQWLVVFDPDTFSLPAAEKIQFNLVKHNCVFLSS